VGNEKYTNTQNPENVGLGAIWGHLGPSWGPSGEKSGDLFCFFFVSVWPPIKNLTDLFIFNHFLKNHFFLIKNKLKEKTSFTNCSLTSTKYKKHIIKKVN